MCGRHIGEHGSDKIRRHRAPHNSKDLKMPDPLDNFEMELPSYVVLDRDFGFSRYSKPETSDT
jgi:hypothetical protein